VFRGTNEKWFSFSPFGKEKMENKNNTSMDKKEEFPGEHLTLKIEREVPPSFFLFNFYPFRKAIAVSELCLYSGQGAGKSYTVET
jgi:hypothetical protein